MPAVPPDPHGQTSLQLRAAIAGDTSSLGWLVAHLSPLLVAQARWRLGPVLGRFYDPEDLVQDAWLTTLPRLGSLTPRDGRAAPVLLRFLATTLLHRVNNLAKHHLRQVAGTTADPSPSVESAPAPITGIVTKAIREEQRHLVLAAIDALDGIDREVLLMRGVEQRSGSTTAQLLGISVDAVAMRYSRALERLRSRLSGTLFDELE